MPRPSVVTIVLGVVCLGMLSVATNFATNALPAVWEPYLWLAWPVIPLLLGLVAVIEVRRARGAPDRGTENARVRAVLLDRVHRYWIRGVLEKSVAQHVRLELGMTVSVDQRHPWRLPVADRDGSVRQVVPGTSIAEVFDELDGLTLILGAPGSGKTTVLLELAGELWRRAGSDPHAPIPIVLTLSSWVGGKRSMSDWIVHEVAARYEIPAAQVRFWLTTDQLVPLLDGLDEVAEPDACAAMINQFRAERGATRTVVSCRAGDYQGVRQPLCAYGTITLQPLTLDQIDAFLAGIGKSAEAVRDAFRHNLLPLELAESPLILGILIRIYRDLPVMAVAIGQDRGEIRDRLFARYVRTVLADRAHSRGGTAGTVRRLALYAAQMRRDYRRNLFNPEDLNKYTPVPGAEKSVIARTAYVCMSAAALMLGPIGFLGYGWHGGLLGAIVGAAIGLPLRWHLNSVNLSLCGRGPQKERPARDFLFYRRFIWGLGDIALGDEPIVVGVVLLCSSASGILLGTGSWRAGFAYGIATAIAMLVAVSLCIEGAEDRHWKHVAPRPGCGEVPSPMARAVILRGTRNAVPVALVTLIIPGLVVTWMMSLRTGLLFAAVTGAGATMYALVAFGGFALVEQWFVRRMLHRNGLAPLPLRPFLDYATECSLLRRVGNDYMFVHLSLMEFFASMWDRTDASATRFDALALDASR